MTGNIMPLLELVGILIVRQNAEAWLLWESGLVESSWLVVGLLMAVLSAWSLLSQRAQAVGVTGPMVFFGTGVVLALSGDLALIPSALRMLAELTLVVVLFHDASTVRLAALRKDAGIALRLLLIGFPVAIVLAGAATWWLLPGIGFAGVVLIAAAITPTDAGLGSATILDPAVPVRVRRALNVESGLNDGLATPIVLAALAAVAGELGMNGPVPAVLDIGAVPLLLGVAVGLALGFLGAKGLDWSLSLKLSTDVTRALAVLTLPVLALSIADLSGGNGFISAFVAGIVFGRAAKAVEDEPGVQGGLELLADLLSFIMWVAAGGMVVVIFSDGFEWPWLAIAVLALTVVRLAAVALSLIGTGFEWPTVGFLAWFGPRGLASIVFALLTIEQLGQSHPLVRDVNGVVGLTVLLSVVLHGVTAGPFASRYGAWAQRAEAPIELEPSPEPMPSRRHRFLAPRHG